jgi:hypothetical protein
MDGIEIEIQFQDIYARFAKESQVAVFCMFLDERAHVVFFHCAFPCHTRYLEFCGRGRDFGFKPRTGSALIPLALRGVRYRPLGAAALLQRNLLIYGVGGIIAPFFGIKLIDVLLTYLRVV